MKWGVDPVEVKYRLFKDNKKKIKENLKDLKVIYSDLDGTLLNDRGCIIKDYKSDYYFEAVRLLPLAAEKNWDIVLVSGRKNFPDKIESNIDWSRYRLYNALFFGEINLEKANKLLKDKGYKGLVMVDNGFSSLINLELGIEKLHIYNLMPFGVNKASGIKLDKRIRNFDTKNCIALGDSLEDLKMADEVKYFLLVQNALEHKEVMLDELRKHNNVFVTNDVMNKGWVEVIGYLV